MSYNYPRYDPSGTPVNWSHPNQPHTTPPHATSLAAPTGLQIPTNAATEMISPYTSPTPIHAATFKHLRYEQLASTSSGQLGTAPAGSPGTQIPTSGMRYGDSGYSPRGSPAFGGQLLPVNQYLATGQRFFNQQDPSNQPPQHYQSPHNSATEWQNLATGPSNQYQPAFSGPLYWTVQSSTTHVMTGAHPPAFGRLPNPAPYHPVESHGFSNQSSSQGYSSQPSAASHMQQSSPLHGVGWQAQHALEAIQHGASQSQSASQRGQNKPATSQPTSNGLRFSFMDEAKRYLDRMLWRAPFDDSTVPDYNDAVTISSHVKSLVDAMLNTNNCHDEGSAAWSHWQRRRYDGVDVEAIAWLVMDHMRIVHTENRGASSWAYRTFYKMDEVDPDGDCTLRDRRLSFERRYNLILDLLTQNKNLCDFIMTKTNAELLVTAPFRTKRDTGSELKSELSAVYTQPRGPAEPSTPTSSAFPPPASYSGSHRGRQGAMKTTPTGYGSIRRGGIESVRGRQGSRGQPDDPFFP